MASEEAGLYQPLAHPRNIRVLSLASYGVDQGQVLRCKFVVQNIDTFVPWAGYNALSYVWGSSPRPVAIRCNDHEIHVTTSLHSALTQIWSLTPNQVLWADAICINQSDDDEKAKQVSMMGDIYRLASTVIIWLPAAANVIPALVELAKSGEQSTTSKDLAVQKFLKDPWFSRAWTLQEVILARQAVLLCGATWMDWRTLDEALLKGIGNIGPFACIRTCTGLSRRKFSTKNRPQLIEAMISSSDRKASDVRDKIYSLLGLVDDATVYDLVDYTISPWELFERVLVLHVRHHEDVSLLHACGPEWDASILNDTIYQPCAVTAWSCPYEVHPTWLPNIADPALLDRISKRVIYPRVSGWVRSTSTTAISNNKPETDDNYRGKRSLPNELLQEVNERLNIAMEAVAARLPPAPADLPRIDEPEAGHVFIKAIPVGLYVSEDSGSGLCQVSALPPCFNESMRHSQVPATIQFTRAVCSDHPKPSPVQFVQSASLDKLEYGGRIPRFFDCVPDLFLRTLAYHLLGSCDCVSIKSVLKRVSRPYPMTLSRDYVNPRVRAGDLLCLLAQEDGFFFLRLDSSLSSLKLVGSAFRAWSNAEDLKQYVDEHTFVNADGPEKKNSLVEPKWPIFHRLFTFDII